MNTITPPRRPPRAGRHLAGLAEHRTGHDGGEQISYATLVPSPAERRALELYRWARAEIVRRYGIRRRHQPNRR